MKFNKVLITVLIMALCSGIRAIGKTIDENTARTVGMNYLLSKGVSLSGASALTTVYTATGTIAGRAVAGYYVFNVSGQHAFVMVAADDIFIPILAYSDESAFDISHMAPATKDWIEGYRKRIIAALANNISTGTTAAPGWSELEAGAAAGSTERTTSAVGPLLGTLIWDQGPDSSFDPGGYYNDSCPGSGTNLALTGCVATAMAQVMKYWNWPTVGTGFSSYSCVTFSVAPIQLSADYGNTVYGWGTMQTPMETTHDPSLAQLMFHAGVSVAMQYDTASSGANTLEAEAYPYTQCAEYALKTYFHYSRSLTGIPRYGIDGDGVDSIPEATWIAMLQNELNAGRPVIYDGYGAAGGHSWVCDGWETGSNKFHFNWGWSGDADGYYTVDALDPYGTSSPDNFDEDEGAIFGIQPDSFPNTAGNIQMRSHLISFNSSPMNYQSPFSVSAKFRNAGTSSFTGDFAMQVFDTSNNLTGTLQIFSGQTLAPADSASYTFDPSVLDAMVPMDYYHVQAMYRPTGTATWTPIANSGTYINYTTADVVNDTDITLHQKIMITSPLPEISGAALKLYTQLINFGPTEFTGTVRAVMINVATGVSYLVDSIHGQNLLPDTGIFSATYRLNDTFVNNSFTAPNGIYALVIQHEYNGAGGFYTTGSTLYENPIIVQVGPDTNASVAATAITNDVYVFPDPAKDMITILPQGVSITAVSLFDLLGRRVPLQIQPNGKGAIMVPVSSLAPGEYIFRLQTAAQQVFTKKVIIAQ